MSKENRIEITIDKEDSEYSVTLHWEGAKLNHTFILPYTEQELDEISRIISAYDETGQQIVSQEKLKEIGHTLYNSLLPSQEMHNTFSRALERGGGEVQLDLVYRDPPIGRYPWELLHDNRMPLVTSGKIDLVRVINTQEPYARVTVKTPLKILVIVSSPFNQHPLKNAPPIESIQDALKEEIDAGRIVVHQLIPPTHDELVKWLSRGYDVVQFYGHGGFSAKGGCLIFQDDLGMSEDVQADELAVILQGRGVQLFVLCACHSGESINRDYFTGVAQSLVGAAGVPAVVGWTYSVPVETALTFMDQFYSALAGDRESSVREAVAQSRRALYRRKTAHFLRLFERTRDDRLIKGGKWSPETLGSLFTIPLNNLIEQLGIHNLLIGRTRDLSVLSRMLASDENVIVLWGFSGIGKTALAVQGVYKQFMWRFPDGVWYVELEGGKQLDTVLTELCGHLNLPSDAPLPVKQQLVIESLSIARTLVLLNNYEDVINDPDIIRFLNGVHGSSKILLTSRDDPKQFSWRTHELKEMYSDEAVILFIRIAERAGKQRLLTDVSLIREICRRVDNFPLSVTYIARSLEGSLQDVLDELDEYPPDPIRKGFVYAYNRTSESARELLSRLTVFGKPFKTAAVRAISLLDNSDSIPKWRACVSELRTRGLIQGGKDVFSLFTMTRQLASETLNNPMRWHSIVADHYASSLHFDPLRGFDHLVEAERWQEAVSVVLGSLELRKYGFAGELISRLRIAAKVSAERLDDSDLEGVCIGSLGLVFRAQGAFPETEREYIKALEIFTCLFEANPDNVEYQSYVATTFNNLGNLLSEMGRPDEALSRYEAALKMREVLLSSTPDNVVYQSDVATTFNNLGVLLRRMGRPDEQNKHKLEPRK